jgi:hypothetical protein
LRVLRHSESRETFSECQAVLKDCSGKRGTAQGCVVHIRSDGCPKQYKCAAAARMMGILGMIFDIEIDWLVNAPHHGKCLVDAITGRDKCDLCNAMIHGMESAQRDEFFKLLSETAKAAKLLNEKHATIDAKTKTITKDNSRCQRGLTLFQMLSTTVFPIPNLVTTFPSHSSTKSITLTHLMEQALGQLTQQKWTTKKCSTSGLTTECQLGGQP